MSVLPAFEHRRATTVAEALTMVGPERLPYAGGTELLLAMRAGFMRPQELVDLKRIDELAAITVTDRLVSIGAAVTHRTAANDPELRDRLPALAATLERVGNARVRAAGTLGGNLCFAEPKSDVAAILIAHRATVRVMIPEETKTLPVEEFILGPYTTALEPGQLLTAIDIPLDPHLRVTYVKYQTMERPTVGVAVASGPAGARLVVGAVGPTPAVFDAGDLDDFDPDAIAADIAVIPDLAGADDYKRHVTAVHIRRAIEEIR